MKKTCIIKKFTAVVLAFAVVITALCYTETPVSAASLKNSTVTAQVSAVSVGAIKIKWNQVSGAKYYRIWRKLKNGSWKRVTTLSSSKSTYLDSGLSSGTTYYYAVRAYGTSGGKGVWSKYKAVKTATVKLADVTAKATAVSNSKITVTWNKVSRAGGYYIWRRLSSSKTWTRLKKVSSSTSSYSDTGVSDGKSYIYCVRAYRTQGGKTNWSKKIESNTVTALTGIYTKFTSSQKDVMKKILYAVETGGQVYGKQDYTDFTEAYTNSSSEYAITIGAGQWYGTEALRLLKLIYQTYPSTFNKLKSNTKNYDVSGLINDMTNKDWSTYKLSESSKKAKTIVAIISTSEGIKCQDQLMYEQIEEYEEEIRALGVTEIKAVGMLINVRHLGGLSSAKAVAAASKTPYTLDNIYTALLARNGSNQVGNSIYKTRHAKVYSWLVSYMK